MSGLEFNRELFPTGDIAFEVSPEMIKEEKNIFKEKFKADLVVFKNFYEQTPVVYWGLLESE